MQCSLRCSPGQSQELVSRFLNREATTSLLNEEERHRFHRALYRLWIIDQLDVIVDRDDLYPSEDETRDLFMKFKAKEIFELQEAIHFLHAIYSTWDPSKSICALPLTVDADISMPR